MRLIELLVLVKTRKKFKIARYNDIMKITLRGLSSWFFGVIFLLAGLGSITSSTTTAVIWIITGLFLIPNIRQKINESYNIEFSTWVVVLLAVIGMGLGSAFANTDSMNTTTSQGGSSSPDSIMDEYYSSVTGFSLDTRTAYGHLCSDVTSETDYLTFDENIRNTKSALNSQGASVELIQIETLREGENNATVQVTQRLEFGMGADNEKLNVTMGKTNSQWCLNETFNPFSG